MKYIKLRKLDYSFYFLPSISLQWDRYYEGGLAYVELNIEWLEWGIEIGLWKDREGER